MFWKLVVLVGSFLFFYWPLIVMARRQPPVKQEVDIASMKRSDIEQKLLNDKQSDPWW